MMKPWPFALTTSGFAALEERAGPKRRFHALEDESGHIGKVVPDVRVDRFERDDDDMGETPGIGIFLFVCCLVCVLALLGWYGRDIVAFLVEMSKAGDLNPFGWR